MDHDEDRSLSLGTEVSASVPPPSPLTGCYLLAVIGEPHTHEHKEIILQRLVKGLLSWDAGEHQVDLEKELATLTAQAPEGEEARYGERLIQFASENLVTEILIHPQMNTLMQCMRNLLSSFTRHRHLVHAGYTFAGNGSWIMQDGTFSLADFTDAYQENEVQRVIRAYENSISIDVHCSTSGGGEWGRLPEMPFVKYCKIRVNPTDKLDPSSQAIKDFISYLNPYVVPASLEQLLVSSDVVGNIRFSHPTLYVFPGGQGDAALFGINGFNMLVDGGFSRKACWWDFARHLDRLDAVLFTRLNNCSASGMSSVLRRKATANVYPQIGHFFCNLEERRALTSPDGDKDADPLLVSLLQEGSDMMTDLRHINLKPQQCYRSPDPINLYHKVGHGTLDMYVLNPSKDSKHVREFLKKWHGSDQKLFEGANISGQFNFPIPNLVSICALLVWRPANPDDTITRIMFPGSTPQHKIFEGLEKLKHLEFLQHPTCTGRQMTPALLPPASVSSTASTLTATKTSKIISRVGKERNIITEKLKEEKHEIESLKDKDLLKDQTDSKNIIDNKLLSELAEHDDKKIESVLHDAITARLETKIDEKVSEYETTMTDEVHKKKDIKKDIKKVVDKKMKRTDKTDEVKETSIKATEIKKADAEIKAKTETKKKTETRSKNEMATATSRSKISHRTTKTIEKKTTASTTADKKITMDEKRSPVTTPKKTVETKTIATAQSAIRDKIKTKTRKLSPGSTPAKSAKEASNRRVAESKYKQASPKRDAPQKSNDKKESKPKREPISRRPRPIASPVKGVKAIKSPSKSVKSIKADSSKLKGLQRVNYEDILKDAKKSDEETSKSLDDIKQQEFDEREEQEIVREIEAVFNRDSEAEEKVEFVGRSDIEKITCLLDNTKTETTADGEFEEEYLIIEKEEVPQYPSEPEIERESSHKQEDELLKHLKDKEESEKKKDDVSGLQVAKPEEEHLKGEINLEIEAKQAESKEHSISVEEKQDISSEKKTSDSKSGPVKPKDSLELVPESHPDEKISTTVESGATTAPTLPEDERITLDDIKEDHRVEEKHVQEETKEFVPPQTLINIPEPLTKEMNLKGEVQSVPIREIVKTPDEVADLPLHEEVDYQTFEEKKTPIEDDIYKQKPGRFVSETKVPKDLPIPDKDTPILYKVMKTIEDDVIIKTVVKPSHAEIVTVTPGSAPDSPIYQQMKLSLTPSKDLQPVKEYSGEYEYGQYTEKLRETHITTLDSPINDDVIVIEEIPHMPEKIPSIPEDVEKEIEEAQKLEMADKPPLSPKDVEKIVADVAEVLKSEKSLEEIMAGKSPTMIRKSPEVHYKIDETIANTETMTEMLLSSEKQVTNNLIQEIKKSKIETTSEISPDIACKEVSPIRSLTSEEVSDVSDKTVFSETNKVKNDSPLLLEKVKDDKTKTTMKKEFLLEETEKIIEKPQDMLKNQVGNELVQIENKQDKFDSDLEIMESQSKLSTTLQSAKTLEKLDEKLANLKSREEMPTPKAEAKEEKAAKIIVLTKIKESQQIVDTDIQEFDASQLGTIVVDDKTESHLDKKAISSVKPGMKTPSPNKDDEGTPMSIKEGEKVPSSIKEFEKVPISIKDDTKVPNLIKDDEKAPSPIKIEEKAPSSIKNEEKKPVPIIDVEKALSPITDDEKAPVAIKDEEKASSPIEDAEKEPMHITGDQKAPSPIKVGEKVLSPVKDDEKAPSPIKKDEKAPSPIKEDKKAPSPIKEDGKVPSSAKDMETTPISINEDEKVSSPRKDDEKVPIAIKGDEKSPSFTKDDEKAPSAFKDDEQVAVSIKDSTKAPSPIKDAEKRPALIEDEKKASSPFETLEKDDMPIKEDEKVSVPTKDDRKATSLTEEVEKAPKPIDLDEKVTSLTHLDDIKTLSFDQTEEESTMKKLVESSFTSAVTTTTSEDVITHKDLVSTFLDMERQQISSTKTTPSSQLEQIIPSYTEIKEKKPVPIKDDLKETSPIKDDKSIPIPIEQDEKAPSPIKEDERALSSIEVVEKEPMHITGDQKAPSPLKVGEKALSPVKDDEKAPSPIKDDEKVPSPIKEDEKAPSPIKQEEKAPSPVKDDEKAPSPIKDDEKAPSPVKDDEKAPSPVKDDEKAPSLIKEDKKAPSPVKDVEKISSPIKDDEKAPSPVKDDEKAPSLIKEDEKTPSSFKDDEKAPSLIKEDEKAPSPVKDVEKTTSPIKDDEKAPSPVKDDEKAPSLIKEDKKAPSPVKDVEKVSSPIKDDEKAPSSVKDDEKISSPIKDDEKAPSPVKDDEKAPSLIKEDKKAPSPVKDVEKISSPIKDDEKAPSPVKDDEKAPSLIKEDKKAPSPVKDVEKISSPIKDDEKAPSPVKDDEKAPSLIKEDKKAPSPVKDVEKISSPIKDDEKAPSPVKDDEKAPSLIKEDKKAPSPVKDVEKISSPIKDDEKAPSPVKDDEKAPSPIKDDEKAPSPVKDDEKAPSLIKEDEKAPSPVKDVEKISSPIKDDEKAPSPVKDDEKAPSPIKEDEKAPSPIKQDEKAPSPVKDDEKAPSPIEVVEEEPMHITGDQKAPSPIKDDVKAPSPVKDDEKTPRQTKDNEKAPSPIKEDDKAPSPIKEDEKAPSPIKQDQKALSPVKDDEKAPSPIEVVEEEPMHITGDQKAPSPIKDDEKAPSPVKDDEKAPSPIKEDEKAPSPIEVVEEEPMLITDDQKAPSPIKDVEKAPSPVKDDEKAPSPIKEDDKAPSPIKEDEKAPSPIKQDQKALSHVKDDEKAPSPIEVVEEEPMHITGDQKAPSPIKDVLKAPSPVKDDEKAPRPIKEDEKAPSPIKQDEKASSPVKDDEKAPSPIKDDEKAPSPIKDVEKAPSPIKDDEKAPSPIKDDEKAPSPIKEDEKAPSPIKEDEKAPSPVKDVEKAPSPIKEDEKAPSPIEVVEEEPMLITDDQKAPSPIKDVEKAPSPVKDDEKAPSPIKGDDKTPSPIKEDEKAPSPIKQDQKALSHVKDDEKAPSPIEVVEEELMHITGDQKAPSPIKDVLKAPSPVKDDEKAPSLIKDVEKAPSPIKEDEKASSPIKKDEKAPSPIKQDEKAPSPVKDDEKAPSLIKEDEKAPSPVKDVEKAPSPIKEDEKAPSPIKQDKKAPSSIKDDEKAPSLIKEDEKAPSPVEDVEKASSPIKDDEKAPSPVKDDEKASSPIKEYKEAPSPVQDDEKVPARIEEDDKAPSLIDTVEKEPKSIYLDKKDTSLGHFDAIKIQSFDQTEEESTMKKLVESNFTSAVTTATSEDVITHKDLVSTFLDMERQLISSTKTTVFSQLEQIIPSSTDIKDKEQVPINDVLKEPSHIKDDEKAPSLIKEEEKASSLIIGEDKVPSPIKKDEKVPSAIKDVEKVPISIKDKGKSSSPIEVVEKEPMHITSDQKAPSPFKVDEKAPSPIKDDKAPVYIKDDTEAPSPIKDEQKPLVSAKDDESAPVSVEKAEKAPSPAKDEEKAPSPIKVDEKAPSPVKDDEKVTVSIKDKAKAPSPIEVIEKEPMTIKLDEKVPSSIKGDDRVPVSIKDKAKAPSPIKVVEKEPMTIKTDEKVASSIKGDETVPVFTKDEEKVTSQIEVVEKESMPIKIDEKVPSPIKDDEKAPSPIKVNEKAPSPVKDDEKVPVSIKDKAKAPSPIEVVEKEPMPIKTDEKTPIDDTMVPSPIKDEQKPPSPVKGDESAPVSIEKAPSPAKFDEKVPVSIKDEEKTPSPIEVVEIELKPIKKDERVRSPVKVDEKARSFIKDYESAQVSTKDDDRVPMTIKDDEKTPSPIKSDEKASSPIKGDEKERMPIKEDEKTLSPTELVIKVPTQTNDVGKATIPIKDAEKTPVQIKNVDKLHSSTGDEEKKPTPLKDQVNEPLPLPVKSDKHLLKQINEKIVASEELPENTQSLLYEQKSETKTKPLVSNKQTSHGRDGSETCYKENGFALHDDTPTFVEESTKLDLSLMKLDFGPDKIVSKEKTTSKSTNDIKSDVTAAKDKTSVEKSSEHLDATKKGSASELELLKDNTTSENDSLTQFSDMKRKTTDTIQKISFTAFEKTSSLQEGEKSMSADKIELLTEAAEKTASLKLKDSIELSSKEALTKSVSTDSEKCQDKEIHKIETEIFYEKPAYYHSTGDEVTNKITNGTQKKVTTIDDFSLPILQSEVSLSNVPAEERDQERERQADGVNDKELAPKELKIISRLEIDSEKQDDKVKGIEEICVHATESELDIMRNYNEEDSNFSKKTITKKKVPVQLSEQIEIVGKDKILPEFDESNQLPKPVKIIDKKEKTIAKSTLDIISDPLDVKQVRLEKDISSSDSCFVDGVKQKVNKIDETDIKQVDLENLEKAVSSDTTDKIVPSSTDSKGKAPEKSDDKLPSSIISDPKEPSPNKFDSVVLSADKPDKETPSLEKPDQKASKPEQSIPDGQKYSHDKAPQKEATVKDLTYEEQGVDESLTESKVTTIKKLVKERPLLSETESTQKVQDCHTSNVLVREGSSEDVSKDISLEEKHSFETSEKKTVKLDADSLLMESSSTVLDSVQHTQETESFTLFPESKSKYESKILTRTELGSSKEEIAFSETSDSGVHSILMDVDHTASGSDEPWVDQLTKHSAVRLMESINKAFEMETVQQGIKVENIEPLVARPDIERMSTPPTVPVSPLPKTPSNFQDIKISDGIQSEVTYDKSEDSEETITKVVHVGEDVLTQKISTSTEKVPKLPKSSVETDDDSDAIALMQTVGKIQTETDTVTKIIKEGENVVTQTITTVTTKEIISREDGTPQNIKTTIETTTLSKGQDGSTTTTKDTETLVSECSSSLRSTSQLDMYSTESRSDYTETTEKSDTLGSFQLKFTSEKEQDASRTLVGEVDELDDNIEDTIIDTDVSKRIIKENNIDIVETITTITKKETVRIDDSKKILRTTIETNVTKEYPDGSKDVQRNVDVKTEELIMDSTTNLDKILTNFTIFGEPEESITTKTEEIKQEDFIIKRTIVTRIIKTKYADKDGIPRKIKTFTSVTTTDAYPDGSARTKVNSNTTLTEINDEIASNYELQGFTVIEDKVVERNVQDKYVVINGKNVLQTITITTTKELLTNKDKIKKKIRTTVETVTETHLPNGMTEVTRDLKVSISDHSHESFDEAFDGFVQSTEPLIETSVTEDSIEENGEKIKRKTYTTTTIKKYVNALKRIERTQTIVKVVTEDEHLDGSVITKTSEKMSLVDDIVDKIQNGHLDRNETEDSFKKPERQDDKVLGQQAEKVEDDGDLLIQESKIDAALKDLTPTDEPEVTETTSIEEIKEKDFIIHREIITRIVKIKYADKSGMLKKLRTTTTVKTTDKYPDGSARTQTESNTTLTTIGTGESDEDLEGFIPAGEPRQSIKTQINSMIENNIEVLRKVTVTTVEHEFINMQRKIKRLKTIVKTDIEDQHPDGSVFSKTSEKVYIVDENLVSLNDSDIAVSETANIEKALENLTAEGKVEETESTQTEEVKENHVIIKRTIVTRIAKTKYVDDEGIVRKIKVVTMITTTDQYPDGLIRTNVETSTSVKEIDESKVEFDIQKAESSYLKSSPVKEEVTPEDEKIKIALKDLVPFDEPEVIETSETQEIVEKETIIRRLIVTKIVRIKYADSKGVLRKLKETTTITKTDTYPDGSSRTGVESSTVLSDINHDEVDIVGENLDGFEEAGEPKVHTTTEIDVITENGILITRKTTTTTIVKEFHNFTNNIMLTKTTVKTAIADEYPDGSIITKTSEKVSLTEETLYTQQDEEDSVERNKVVAALQHLTPADKPEVSETTRVEEIKDGKHVIKRNILTKIEKTKYCDKEGKIIKQKTVTTVTTADHYPDGSIRTTVDTSTSVSDMQLDDMPQTQALDEFTNLEDKSVSVRTDENLTVRDGKKVKQIITTTTTKEVLASADESKKKIRTTTEVITETKLPTGVTEVTKDVKVSVADYGVEMFDENLTGYTEVGEPKEHTTMETEHIKSNGLDIIRKIAVTTIRQEYENTSIRSRKIKTNVKTVVEDEYPDGTVITKKSEKVSIADVFLKTPAAETEADDTEHQDSYIDDNEIVEDTTEESDVKNETIQQGSLIIKRIITTKTKRDTLASNDVNVKRVRTTVETVTVDEYPDGSTETTKDVKITISEFQKTSGSDLQAALQGLNPTGKIKTSVDKKTNVIMESGMRITQTITTYVTKEELKNDNTNEIAVKTVTETITENAKDDGTVETTKDVRTQITYLPIGTGLDDWSPEELEEIEKQPVAQEEKPKVEDLPLKLKPETKVESKQKKQRSPVGEITTETDTYTKIVKEGENEITQTITVVTTKEVISPEKIKITVETTTVSKGSDGVIKTTKSTKTTISEIKEEYEEIIDTGESEKSFSKLSSKTGDMRSSSAASDDLDHPGTSSPSDISSRGSRAATHFWGTESSGIYYSDDDGQASPSSTKSQIAHSPRSNLSFELDAKQLQQLDDKDMDTALHKDPMSSSIYGQLPEDDSCASSSHSDVKSVVEKSVTKKTEEFLTQEKLKSDVVVLKKSDATFLKEADEHFEKAIEEHKKVSGSDVISSITAKYELDTRSHSSSSKTTSKEESITLKDIKTETKKSTETSSSHSKKSSTERFEQSSKTFDKDPIESWGKPLGLPSPIMPPNQHDGKSTPKKQNTSSTILNKNKLNQEKSKEAKRASESPSKKKTPAPVYMELTYVPHHGNSYYSAVEFFKRVRARYYVFSGTEPSKEIYNALLDAKKTWEDKDLEVTIIPTYDTDVLGYWVTENEEALEKYKIDLSPSASRCTINLQDHETSCAAYRLEF
ncbi:microtubule-associated protein futsch [Bombyx mandarina]|uniref:Microtubule-associated protein futsch n=1 Tax=Bombyx mandarina TaxID=7092 RepID=A0A6J2K360_BOMMA|nr:microtubule-associated protein futsch [Bombyx mandarina]